MRLPLATCKQGESSPCLLQCAMEDSRCSPARKRMFTGHACSFWERFEQYAAVLHEYLLALLWMTLCIEAKMLGVPASDSRGRVSQPLALETSSL